MPTKRLSPAELDALADKFWQQEFLREKIAEQKRVVLGISGGADSTALLWLMTWKDRPDWSSEIAVGHVNHALRGKASDADQERVRANCRQLGVTFRSRKLRAKTIQSAAGGSLEAALREARYTALTSIMQKAETQTLILAHHRDDLAETFLMRLMRGSGLAGLRGILPESQRAGMAILRPLLDWSAAHLRAIAQSCGLQWADDESNDDLRFTRNRIRKRIIPYLDRHSDHGAIAGTLARTAGRIREEYAALESVVDSIYREHIIVRQNPLRLGMPREALLQFDAALAPHLIRNMFRQLMEDNYPPDQPRIDELAAFIKAGKIRTPFQSARNVVAYLNKEDIFWLWQKPQRNIPRETIIQTFES
ncbi:MAG: tRNA lysidine(34) synthetase TilS [bacterium]